MPIRPAAPQAHHPQPAARRPLASESPRVAEALDAARSALSAALAAAAKGAGPASQDACLVASADKFEQLAAAALESDLGATHFVFRDGPVTRAIKLAGMLLLESFDLPAASVTERLNSLLEPTPFFSLTEDFTVATTGSALTAASFPGPRSGDVTPLPGFAFFATVHRAEPTAALRLSPAARSRLTEIACARYDAAGELWHLLAAQLAERLRPDEAREAPAVLDMMRDAFSAASELRQTEVRRSPLDVHRLFTLVDFVVRHPPSSEQQEGAGGGGSLQSHLPAPRPPLQWPSRRASSSACASSGSTRGRCPRPAPRSCPSGTPSSCRWEGIRVEGWKRSGE